MNIHTLRIGKLLVHIGIVAFATIIAPQNARADMVVIVNASNKVEIDDNAVARIYLAQVKTFPGGGEALAVDQKDGSAARSEFSDKLLKRAPAHIKSYWAQQKYTGNLKPLPQLKDDDAVLKYVAETPNAIGYVDSAKVHGGVRVVMKL